MNRTENSTVTQRRIICNDDFRTIMSHDQCKFHYPASADDLASLVGRGGIVIAVGHRPSAFSLPIRQGQVTAERRRARQSRSHAEPVRGWRIFVTNNRSASHDAHRFGTPTWSLRPKQWAGPTPSPGSRRRPTTPLNLAGVHLKWRELAHETPECRGG